MLTLLGLILAIGIVVDDAIVVVENVDRIMNEERLSPYEATKKAMGSLSGALIAMSLVLCAVFVPVSFLCGHHGPALPPVHHYDRRVGDHLDGRGADAQPRDVFAFPANPKPGDKKNRIFRRINLGLATGNRFYGRMIRGGAEALAAHAGRLRHRAGRHLADEPISCPRASCRRRIRAISPWSWSCPKGRLSSVRAR